MKPVAIFRFAMIEGPGYFATFLARNGIPAQLIAIDEGLPVPASLEAFSGVCLMGGPMSVNDDLAWIPRLLDRVREAVADDKPVIGHCLGGQLLAKALGAIVTHARNKEIGWGEVTVAATPAGERWFGDVRAFDAFHWHGETFGIPESAELILWSRFCAHQAFAMGKHFGLQCHVEMTPDMIRNWCENGAREIAEHPGPGVQETDAILQDVGARAARLSNVADRIYTRWVMGLSRAD